MIFFMFRNSRKRKRDAEELQSKIVPGAEVMTQHGIYGTLISVDDEKNEAIIETTPGTQLRVHRQTISRVVDPVEARGRRSTSLVTDDRRRSPAGEPSRRAHRRAEAEARPAQEAAE